MKAIMQRGYGEPAVVLELREVPAPRPRDHEVLVRVRASSVNPGDWFGVVGEPYLLRLALGLRRPRRSIPGRVVAGTVEAVGGEVTRLRQGDRVYGELPGGGYAEYTAAAEKSLAVIPERLDFGQAAAVPLAGTTAWQGMRLAGVRAGQRVLINGASGGVGTFAVQIARSLGAHVIAVCHTRNIELVRSIGATEAIDYTRDDFTRPSSGHRPYDVIFDLIGNHTLPAFRGVLSPTGVYIASAGRLGGPVLGAVPFLLKVVASGARPGSRKVKPFAATPDADDLTALGRLIEAGEVTPVIDRTYTLAETPQALAYQGEGHAQGKTIVMV